MKIALCSSFVPFIYGGAKNYVDWLGHWLEKKGHQIEYIYLPHVDNSAHLFQQFAAYRWIDLTDTADKIICFRPPSHLIPHPNKVVWFPHHIRIFYDLWESHYRSFPNNPEYEGLRDALHQVDRKALLEAKKIFTISKVVSNRLKKYNNLDSEILYPPVLDPSLFFHRKHNDEIICISRLEHHKRQHLLIEAMRYTKTTVKLRICGAGSSSYIKQLKAYLSKYNLQKRVILNSYWIDENEKIQYLADCLATAYVPLDEDYGYLGLESMYASKPMLTTSDSGGILELIQNGVNGIVTEPKPEALAQAMDKLFLDKDAIHKMSLNSAQMAKSMNINWSYVIERLLS
jgi:glycosyltransferase involved in cell wall biosynthesis